MQTILTNLYNILNDVIPGQVNYGIRESTEEALAYIVYQEISNRGMVYADDRVKVRIVTIQINLIEKTKNLEIEQRLEMFLYVNDYTYQMVSEYQNDDGSINRVYEIKMEVL